MNGKKKTGFMDYMTKRDIDHKNRIQFPIQLSYKMKTANLIPPAFFHSSDGKNNVRCRLYIYIEIADQVIDVTDIQVHKIAQFL